MATTLLPGGALVTAPEAPSSTSMFLWRLRRNPKAMIGGTIVLVLLLLIVVAPLLAPADPLDGELSQSLIGPSPDHSWAPTRTAAMSSAACSTAPHGGRGRPPRRLHLRIDRRPARDLGAYKGGWVDEAVTRLWDMLLAFPPLLLAFAVVAALGPGLEKSAVALSILYVPFIARVVRGVTLVQKEMTYTEAARALGYRHGRIVFRHILPNCLSPIICHLARHRLRDARPRRPFLPRSRHPAAGPRLGRHASEGQLVLLTAPHVALAAGAAIVVAVLGFNLLGDGLRDAPRPTAGSAMTALLGAAPLLRLDGLKIHFRTRGGDVRAVDGVDLEIRPGEIVGLVGESGSGKSVTARSIMRLVPMPPGKHVGGRILFHGHDLLGWPTRRCRSCAAAGSQ
jgi:peptide/nickel transport system permease protein